MGLVLVFSEPLANDGGDSHTFCTQNQTSVSFHERVLQHQFLGPGFCEDSNNSMLWYFPRHSFDLGFSNDEDTATVR